MKDLNTIPAKISIKSVVVALNTLVLAEKRKTSTRNAFQIVIQNYRELPYENIQAAYHYVQELSRKREILEYYLESITSTLSNHRLSLLNDSLIRNFLLLAIYLLKEEQYSGTPPSLTKLKKLMRVVLAREGHVLSTPQKIFLDDLLKKARDLDLKDVRSRLQKSSLNERLSFHYNFPRWLIKKLLEQHEKALVEKLLQSENHQPKRYFRIRLPYLKKVNEILAALPIEDSTVKITQWPIEKHSNQDERVIILEFTRFDSNMNAALNSLVPHVGVIQDKASALIPTLLLPIQDEIVLDLAAGPGQKFTQLLEYSQRSHVLGCEYNENRLNTMQRWVSTLTNWTIRRGTRYHLMLADGTEIPLKENQVDKVLLDAPCSSTGILAKYPDHRWHRVNLDFITTLQRNLLESAIKVLKPGGIGVYSVCSLLKDEGEWIITKFLDKIDLIPFDHENSWSIPSDVGKRVFRHLHGTDNFFVALFRKK